MNFSEGVGSFREQVSGATAVGYVAQGVMIKTMTHHVQFAFLGPFGQRKMGKEAVKRTM